MGIEIERKFLVNGMDWKHNIRGIEYRQGYLTLDPGRTVRVRTADNTGYLTIKGASQGIARLEFEYGIPFADAVALLDGFCIQPLIEKKRYRIEYQGFIWEVDEFAGKNSGLIIAEIELEYEDQVFSAPAWVGREVTGDPRYFNASLVRKPWNTWHD